MDEYFKAATTLAVLLRRAFDHPGTVKKAQLKRALVKFERVDMEATR